MESDLTYVGCENSILICVPIPVMLALNHTKLQSRIHSRSEFIHPHLYHWHDSLHLLDQRLAEEGTCFSHNKFHIKATENNFVTAGSIVLLSQFYIDSS